MLERSDSFELERIFFQILEVFDALIHKKYLLQRKDLTLEWRPFFNLFYRLEDSGDAQRGLIKVPATTKLMVRSSRDSCISLFLYNSCDYAIVLVLKALVAFKGK